ncbi:glycoside hydrolase family 97 protein [Xylanibacter brevis]|uniref:glycoside hydrolase family 97 protein n=1 Tax=Xylanibacter brevis TaxID=83231 RepID=UPI000486BC25|nr:glycoside hydrolase family 97 protein [Xylanibacter brevis]
MRKLILNLAILAMMPLSMLAQKTLTLTSPSGEIRVNIAIGDSLSFAIEKGAEQLLSPSGISLQNGKKLLGVKPRLRQAKRSSINEQIKNLIPLKNAVTPNVANVLTLQFADNYNVEFRAYDNGVAYRFILKGKGTTDIVNEGMTLNLAQDMTAHLSQCGSFMTSYEEEYSHLQTSTYKADDKMTHLPILLETQKGTKLLFSESDLRDYPAMFLKSTGNNGLTALFPRSPEKWEPRGDRSETITQEGNYIARTSASRSLPWRFLVIGDDATIAANEMERILGGKSQLADASWIRPGKVSWDWWNHWTVWDVDFVTGINNQTYKYFIDFSSKYGIEYILLDEGWNKDVRNPFVTIDDIDVKELVDYGREKGVGVWLWLSWLTVEQNMDLIPFYAKMGVKGLKVDFMDHSDQWMVNFYERVAKACADNKLMVDFHGSFKPAGLEMRYPNIVSYEGVRGMENNQWCRTENTIWQPFMRNAVGGMDFTPGSMQSAQPEDNHSCGSLPQGTGTRAYQMAMYVVFESAFQMLADSPTRYLREDECTRFIASVPTTWDETRVLAAKAGSYYAVAKRKGNKWYLGAITANNAQELKLNLDFLKTSGQLTSFEDGKNAYRIAVDYKKRQQPVSPATTMTIKLTRNGGWCGVIE